MKLIRTLHSGLADGPEVALAVGNFDGLHLGHQALLRAALARAPGLEPALMCFEPLPATLFRPDQPVPRLMGVRDRLLVARQLGIQRMYMPRFDHRFAALSPEDFVGRVLVGAARARHVVVGEDFRFGARAAGDVDRLRELGRQHELTVQVIASVRDQAEKISSSRLRALLQAGRFADAERLLGRPYALNGRVLRGQALGRQLGFPTVNLRPPVPPVLSGVFAVRVSGAGLDASPGVANLGCRPTVAGSGWLLEVHLFDYSGDLYGAHLRVEFVARLRAEEKFASLTAMVEQMHQDSAQARQLLALPA